MSRNALVNPLIGALTGAIIWLALLVSTRLRWLDLEWIDLLFLLAPLVVVPLGLKLNGEIERDQVPPGAERLARAIQLPCALGVVASFFFARGMLAAVLASTWLVFCGLMALGAVMRVAKGAFRVFDSVFPVFAFLYLPIGAAWLVASRLGLSPLGFQEPIVLLTAVHFHYAGLAAPLLARSSRLAFCGAQRNSAGAILLNLISVGVLAGPAMLAAGFVVGPRMKLTAATVLAASEAGLALTFLFALPRIERVAPKLLISLSAASVAVAMVLAALWAIGEYPLQPFVHLAEMARFHGTANAFGFTLCGLIGWSQARAGSHNSTRGKL